MRLLPSVLVSMMGVGTLVAAPPRGGPKFLSVAPITSDEARVAYEASARHSCELLAEDLPIESPRFARSTLLRSPLAHAKSAPTPVEASRLQVFCAGLEMLDDDRQRLPVLAQPGILNYLAGHYASIQVRLVREGPMADWCLYDRASAATCMYKAAPITLPFNESVAEAVQRIRTIGYFVGSEAPSANTLRTLVLVHRHDIAISAPSDVDILAQPTYELLVVHARAAPGANDGSAIELHTFCTSAGCGKWHYLVPAAVPRSIADCGVRSSVVFTGFAPDNLTPTASVARRIEMKSQIDLTPTQLDAYCEKQHWTGGTAANLTAVLEAIITRKIDSP